MATKQRPARQAPKRASKQWEMSAEGRANVSKAAQAVWARRKEIRAALEVALAPPASPLEPPPPPEPVPARRPAAAAVPWDVETVRIPRELFNLLRAWPGLMDRARNRAPYLISMQMASEVPALHHALDEVARRDTGGSQVSLPKTLYFALKAWLPFFQRLRFSPAGLSMNDLANFAESERLMEQITL